MRTEQEVDAMIEDMIKRTKGKYITQACAFNKTCPRQIELLKKALMSSVSFSGLIKESLALRFNSPSPSYSQSNNNMSQNQVNKAPKSKSVGNFL
ncbi:hypothetical protein pW2_129 [Bacillus phage pW2]|uniref:Uncharacterized protein n=1 Tax=Bacillus phage pW2 TaxID=2500559 RepID=A0A3Q9R7G7_9CAUD|nr:hypothetical protein PQE69_gp157 [Bacillus phage pW2]AZU98961.1 hypothetical protein pW2_129 [Bacillus phage pW2]